MTSEPLFNLATRRWERRDLPLERYLEGKMSVMVCACGFQTAYPPDMMSHAAKCAFWPHCDDDKRCEYCQRYGAWSVRGEKSLDQRNAPSLYCSNECRASDEAISAQDAHPPYPR